MKYQIDDSFLDGLTRIGIISGYDSQRIDVKCSLSICLVFKDQPRRGPAPPGLPGRACQGILRLGASRVNPGISLFVGLPRPAPHRSPVACEKNDTLLAMPCASEI